MEEDAWLDAITQSMSEVNAYRKEADLRWENHQELLREAKSNGLSYQKIAKAMGVTKARAYQIITGKRSK